MTTHSNQLSKVIVVALILWGAYLALGASGVWQSEGTAFDLRKASIVAVCSLMFLALWRIAVMGKSRRDVPDSSGDSMAESEPKGDLSHRLPILGWLPLVCAVSAWIVALAPLFVSIESRRSAVVFLMFNLVLWLAAMISGIIQLSSPNMGGKRSSGLAVLLGAALAVYVLVSPLIPRATPSSFSPPNNSTTP